MVTYWAGYLLRRLHTCCIVALQESYRPLCRLLGRVHGALYRGNFPPRMANPCASASPITFVQPTCPVSARVRDFSDVSVLYARVQVALVVHTYIGNTYIARLAIANPSYACGVHTSLSLPITHGLSCNLVRSLPQCNSCARVLRNLFWKTRHTI